MYNLEGQTWIDQNGMYVLCLHIHVYIDKRGVISSTNIISN